MIRWHRARNLFALTSMSTLVAGLLISGCTPDSKNVTADSKNVTPDSENVKSRAGATTDSGPDTDLDTDTSHIPEFDTATQCGKYRLWFNGVCRDVSFFSPLRSAGGKLYSVAGPRKKLPSTDTGVVITEVLGPYITQHLFISPAKSTGGLQQSGYLYRKRYPVVGSVTYTYWKDSGGPLNRFTEVRGPTAGKALFQVFGTTSWVHWVKTASGHKEKWSDGTWNEVIASTGDTSTGQAAICTSQGLTAEADYLRWCDSTVLTSAVGQVLGGLLVGGGFALIFVGTGGAGAVAVAMVAIGGTAGGATGTLTNVALGEICEADSKANGKAAEAACLNPAVGPAPTDFQIVANPADGKVNVNEPCPPGQFHFSGTATYCAVGGSQASPEEVDTGTSDNQILGQLGANASEDEVSEEITVIANQSAMAGPTCATSFLLDQCVILQ